MGESGKSIRLVTALVECRPDGEYAPWGIKWYNGKIYPFNRIESYSPRSWAMARAAESALEENKENNLEGEHKEEIPL